MVRVKIFKVRIDEKYRDADESFLNDFLESVKTVQVKPTIVHAPPEIFWSVFVAYEELEEEEAETAGKILFDSSEALTPEEEEIFFKLKTWRNNRSTTENLPAYLILHDSHLKTIIKIKPRSKKDFYKLQGISKRKIDKYWKDVFKIITESE